MENIDKLKQLTDKLPPIPKLRELVIEEHDNVIEYDTTEGYTLGRGLMNKKDICVQDMLLTKGADFPAHNHIKEIEYGIIYKGSIEVTIDGKKQIVKAGDCVKFDKGSVHTGTALETTKLLAVAIPRIDGYPQS